VSVAAISASVGYNASTSYSTGASDTFPIGPNSPGGAIQVASTYATTPVYEAVAGDPALGSATVLSNEYVAPTFQYVSN
jgi:hypothetical protein